MCDKVLSHSMQTPDLRGRVATLKFASGNWKNCHFYRWN